MPERISSEYFESRVCSSCSDHFFRFIVGETVTFNLTEFGWTVIFSFFPQCKCFMRKGVKKILTMLLVSLGLSLFILTTSYKFIIEKILFFFHVFIITLSLNLLRSIHF